MRNIWREMKKNEEKKIYWSCVLCLPNDDSIVSRPSKKKCKEDEKKKLVTPIGHLG